jgi:hypothetical protein
VEYVLNEKLFKFFIDLENISAMPTYKLYLHMWKVKVKLMYFAIHNGGLYRGSRRGYIYFVDKNALQIWATRTSKNGISNSSNEKEFIFHEYKYQR